MKVARLQLFHVEVPTPRTFYPAWLPSYPQTENRFTLLRLVADDGRVGLAAGPAFNRERAGLGLLLGPYLIGLRVDDLETVRQRIREASFLGWRNPWIEMAFLDLWGQAEGKSIAALLGGRARPLEAYASTGEATTPENAAAKVDLARDAGTGVVKLRAHAATLAQDVAMVRAAAAAARDRGVRVAVDANQGWFVTATGPAERWDLPRARAFARALRDADGAWLEEPLDMRDWAGLRALRNERLVPLAGAELAGARHELQPMLDPPCLDIFQPDATLCGGADTSLWVARECRARGLGFAPHTWTNGLGLLYNAHILAASGADGPLEWPLDPPGWTPEVRDGLLTQPLRLDDGRFQLPDAPGLGATLDDRALKRHGTKFYDANAATIAWQFVRSKGLLEAIRYRRRRAGDGAVAAPVRRVH